MKTYEIYDGEKSSLFDDYPVIEAKTGKEAIEKHLAKTNRKYYLRRSKNNDVVFSATQFREENGNKIKVGNVVWYAIYGKERKTL